MRYPAVGDDTLLDALCQVGRFNDLRTKRIWIARPQPGSIVDQVLPVHWKWTSDQTATGTNYHILPGDRIFVKELPWWMKLIEKVAAFQGWRRLRFRDGGNGVYAFFLRALSTGSLLSGNLTTLPVSAAL